MRSLTREHGTLLINDETHTFSAGPGGATRAWDLDPDIVTIGKAIAGGVPSGAFGISTELAERIAADRDADLVDTGGVGGTLAGNALSSPPPGPRSSTSSPTRRSPRMTDLATRFAAGVQEAIDAHDLAWSVAQIGARVEYRFASPPPRTGSEAAAADDRELEDFLHVHLANRGVMITPFHMMALMCPATTGRTSTGTRKSSATLSTGFRPKMLPRCYRLPIWIPARGACWSSCWSAASPPSPSRRSSTGAGSCAFLRIRKDRARAAETGTR